MCLKCKCGSEWDENGVCKDNCKCKEKLEYNPKWICFCCKYPINEPTKEGTICRVCGHLNKKEKE